MQAPSWACVHLTAAAARELRALRVVATAPEARRGERLSVARVSPHGDVLECPLLETLAVDGVLLGEREIVILRPSGMKLRPLFLPQASASSCCRRSPPPRARAGR